MQSADLLRLQPPARDVPGDVRLLVRLARLEGLMFFLTLTALLAAIVVPNTDWRGFLFAGAVDGVKGTVVNAEERGYQEGKQTVSRVYFEFERGGKKESGNSHFVGSRPRIGDEVRIEWPRDHPEVTRIEDARTGPLHRGALAVLFFPLFVLMMTQAAWRMASISIQAMRDGVPAPKANPPGLASPSTGEVLLSLEDLPRGVEVGMDGVWSLDSSSRLTRPSVVSVLGAGALGWLAWTVYEMVAHL
ncbi:MAG: hypothetical protein K1Y01_05460 [Vicinamibacteria bacterium]|nr:hypothetical protein [Vicinamibacteria bacterium]